MLLYGAGGYVAPPTVNAETGYYIRARVANVENYLSTIPRWILPFVKGIQCIS